MKTDTWLCGPPPAQGQKQRYPSRFWYNFRKNYPIDPAARVLHMFSGSMDWGDTTDMRPDSGAQIIAKYDQLPIKDGTYDMVIADPPYTCGFANEWIEHPKDLPKPKRILFEATRVAKPGGLIAILHVIVIPAYKDAFVERVALHPILCGPNNAIRVLNVFRKKEKKSVHEFHGGLLPEQDDIFIGDEHSYMIPAEERNRIIGGQP